ncbi:MAG: CD1375 family protein [Oscillospiraceae bacterium]
MAKVYYNLIKKGLKTIEDVPQKWRSEVEKLLAGDLNERNETVS